MEISQTISSVMHCMACWTHNFVVCFASCQTRVEPPQVPLTMRERSTCHTLPVMRVYFAQALTSFQTLTVECDLHS